MPILDPFEDVVQFHRPRGFESRAYAYDNVATNIPSGAGYTLITLDTVWYDTLNEFDPVVTYSFTATNAGWYFVKGQLQFGAVALVWPVSVRILLNGGDYFTSGQLLKPAGLPVSVCTSGILYMEPGDIIRLYGSQSSGGALNCVTGIGQTHLMVHRVG